VGVSYERGTPGYARLLCKALALHESGWLIVFTPNIDGCVPLTRAIHVWSSHFEDSGLVSRTCSMTRPSNIVLNSIYKVGSENAERDFSKSIW